MKFLLCFDDQDGEIGPFVERCAEDSKNFIDQMEVDLVELNTRDLTEFNIKKHANEVGEKPFVCIVYSHGESDCLWVKRSGDEFISTESNFDVFQNAFVYTWACDSGQILGKILCENHCAAFIGYLVSVVTVIPEDEDFDLFVKCAIIGLKEFYLNNKNVFEVYCSMKQEYEKLWDHFFETDLGNVIQVQELSNSLVIHGDETLDYERMFQEGI